MSFFTYLDRSNLSFAAFQFKADMDLSNSVYGLGRSYQQAASHSLVSCNEAAVYIETGPHSLPLMQLQVQAYSLWATVLGRPQATLSCGMLLSPIAMPCVHTRHVMPRQVLS